MKRHIGLNGRFCAFLDSEVAGGLLLIASAILAMLCANSFLEPAYHASLNNRFGNISAHLVINDGLMAIFFLLVGLEIKREFRGGELATWRQRRLPMIAAAAGMAVPALLYLAITALQPELTRGWAIPAATDIAFAIGVLALLGKRVPASLKLFLVTVAIVDDLGAVVIIALFYTASLDPVACIAAAILWGGMMLLARAGVRSLALYMLCFALLWFATLTSGVHATVAGVFAAMAIPDTGTDEGTASPLHRLEQVVRPWAALLIVPLFGFANAGVDLRGLTPSLLFAPLPLGIAAGLFLGKQIGIFSAVWIAVRTGLAPLPRGASWRQVHGVALVCGIGFTMSLFIAGLAFPDAPGRVEEARLGILMGSLISALVGFALLRFASSPATDETEGGTSPATSQQDHNPA